MEILYNLRLGSELDCKYGPDLEIKHFFFQVKEEKINLKTQEKRNEERKQCNRSPTDLSGVKFHNIVN